MTYRQHAIGRPKHVPVARGNRPLVRRRSRHFVRLTGFELEENDPEKEQCAASGFVLAVPISLALWSGIAAAAFHFL